MSSNNSSTTIDDAPSQATVIFTTVGLLIFSVLGISSSLLTVVVISSSKVLHTPCFILICGGAVGSFMVAAHYLVRGVKNILLTFGVIGSERTGLQCLFLDGVFGVWGIAFHSKMACLVGIDRLISIVLRFRYRSFGKRYAVGVLAICAIVTTVQELVGFLTANLYETISCTEFQQAMHINFMHVFASLNLFYCTFNVAIYAAMLVCFHYRQKFYNEAAMNDNFTKQQLSVMPTIKLMTLLYSITGILAEVLMNIGFGIAPNEPFLALINVGAVFKDASSCVEGFSLSIRSKKFRRCFKRLVGFKTSSVGAMTSGKNVVKEGD